MSSRTKIPSLRRIRKPEPSPAIPLPYLEELHRKFTVLALALRGGTALSESELHALQDYAGELDELFAGLCDDRAPV